MKLCFTVLTEQCEAKEGLDNINKQYFILDCRAH